MRINRFNASISTKLPSVEIQPDILSNERPVPKFGPPAGITGIFAYLLGSFPVLVVVGIIAAQQHAQKIKTNPDLPMSEVLEDISKNPWTSVAALTVQCIVFVGVLVLVSNLRGSKNWRNDIGFNFRAKSVWYFFVGIGLQIIGILSSIVFIALKDEDTPTQEIVTTVKESRGVGFVCLMLLVAVIVPIVEEMCFRGLFLRSLGRRYAPWIAVLISGSVFAAVHLSDPNAILGTTQLLLVGLTCAVLSMYHGRLDSAIFTHIGFNTATVVLILLAR